MKLLLFQSHRYHLFLVKPLDNYHLHRHPQYYLIHCHQIRQNHLLNHFLLLMLLYLDSLQKHHQNLLYLLQHHHQL
jgi:hypothetical protein